jgi:hypothetical protein
MTVVDSVAIEVGISFDTVRVTVWMQDLLGGSDDLEGGRQRV